MLVVLAVLNALFTTSATVLDARRSSALMRALGARVPQVSSGPSSHRCSLRCRGAILGIPLGLRLFKAGVNGGTLPPPLWFIATVVETLVALAALTILPARISARQPVTETLQRRRRNPSE